MKEQTPLERAEDLRDQVMKQCERMRQNWLDEKARREAAEQRVWELEKQLAIPAEVHSNEAECDRLRGALVDLLMDLQRTGGDVFCPCCMAHSRVVKKHRALLRTKETPE